MYTTKAGLCTLVVWVVLSSCNGARIKGKEFGPRPRLPKILHLDQCEMIAREDCLNNTLPRGKLICVQLTEETLFKKLKDIGGYNPNFVAMNRTEAAKFKDPRLFSSSKQTRKILPTRSPDCKTTKKTPTTSRPPTTRRPRTRPPSTRRPRTRPPRTRRPRTRPPRTRRPWTRPPRRVRRGKWRKNRRPQDQPEEPEVDQSNDIETRAEEKKADRDGRVLLRSKRSTQETRQCWNRAALIENSNPSRYRLCGECHVITHLDDDIRPRYINEAVCKHAVQSNAAQDDKQCAWDSGLCEQRTLTFPAIRLTGTFGINSELSNKHGREIYSEVIDDQSYTQTIRASCQCQVYVDRAEILRNFLSKSSS